MGFINTKQKRKQINVNKIIFIDTKTEFKFIFLNRRCSFDITQKKENQNINNEDNAK